MDDLIKRKGKNFNKSGDGKENGRKESKAGSKGVNIEKDRRLLDNC